MKTPAGPAELSHPRAAVAKVTNFLEMLLRSVGLSLTFQTALLDVPVSSIHVTFVGPDTSLLTSHNGELLHALEHIAAKLLRLESEQHDRVTFDASSFKANRHRAIQSAADAAVQQVRASHQPFSFSPMNSRERRLLHLALNDSGLLAASAGEGPQRHVVLYPEGHPASYAAATSNLPQHN